LGAGYVDTYRLDHGLETPAEAVIDLIVEGLLAEQAAARAVGGSGSG
jgi:hypothetical protein